MRSADNTVNPRWFHPGCVEGRLGPFDTVQGAQAMPPESQDSIRGFCDGAGRATRAQYVEDVCSAKRARANHAGDHRDSQRPLASPDDGSPGELPEDVAEDQQGAPDLDGVSNMEWWDSISYDSLGTWVPTILSFPAEVEHGLALLRGAVAKAILEARAAGDVVGEKRACKLLTFFDRLLLFKPSRVRGGRKQHNQGGLSQVLTRRIRLARRGDWGALWREAMSSATQAPRRAGRPPTVKEDVQAVESLLDEGLISKAMARIARVTSFAVGPRVLPELQALFPEGAQLAAAVGAGQVVSADTRTCLKEAAARCTLHSPRRSGPGPNGSRFEHWRVLKCDDRALEATAQVIVLFLLGELPHEAMVANLGARLFATRKKNGKLRPLACGGVLRRLAARAACEVFREEITAACGRDQYAVGRKAGTELVHKSLTALAEATPSAAVLAFDASNAFNTLPRPQVFNAAQARVPELAVVAQAWLGQATTHLWWDGDDDGQPVIAHSGVDQGCPLSPAFFAMGIASALAAVRTRLLELSPSAHVFSCLDNIVVMVPADLSARAAAIVAEELTRAGLTVEASKTQAWTLDPATVLPEGIAQFRVPNFKCLGNTVPWLEREEEEVSVHSGADGAEALAKATKFVTHLKALHACGLSTESSLVLLRTYAQGCATHLLRANFETEGWVDQVDHVLWATLAELVGGELSADQKQQATLRLRDGGLAFPHLRASASAAFVGSWALTLRDVTALLGVSALEDFRARCPRTHAALAQAEVDVRTRGSLEAAPFDWLGCLKASRAKVQGECAKKR